MDTTSLLVLNPRLLNNLLTFAVYPSKMEKDQPAERLLEMLTAFPFEPQLFGELCDMKRTVRAIVSAPAPEYKKHCLLRDIERMFDLYKLKSSPPPDHGDFQATDYLKLRIAVQKINSRIPNLVHRCYPDDFSYLFDRSKTR